MHITQIQTEVADINLTLLRMNTDFLNFVFSLESSCRTRVLSTAEKFASFQILLLKDGS